MDINFATHGSLRGTGTINAVFPGDWMYRKDREVGAGVSALAVGRESEV